jgi:tRNA uridine 5-carbamoylmethylation protein Kti12
MKKLILMQGIPGSGKSTLANLLAEKWGGSIYSTDEYWGPEYRFNPFKLREAHLWNQRRVLDAMVDDRECIIVDNTNITKSAASPYLNLAEMYGYEVQVVRVVCSTVTALKRGTHNVPFDKISQMNREMEDLL